jgi:hypothetical protein
LAPTDDAAIVEDKEGARARSCLLVIDAVRPTDGSVGVSVGKQWVVDARDPNEGDMTPDVVGGDREEHGAVPCKLGEVVLVQG